MTLALVELIAHFAIFLDLADESTISLEAAAQLQEEMAFRLQSLSPNECSDFLSLLAQVAQGESSRERQDVLRRLPEEMGLL